MSENPKISAILLSFNSENHLEGAVTSLAAAFDVLGGDHEIFVIENGSADKSPDILQDLAKRYPRYVKPIFCSENTGTTVSRNMGLRDATGDYILVMDSDVTLGVDVLPALLEKLRAAPGCGMIAPQLRYPSGALQLSVDQFPTLTRKAQRLFALKDMEDRLTEDARPEIVDYAISAFWLMPREAVQKVGLFDEAIFYSPEDVDYCIRMWKAGYYIRYEPSVHAIHDAQELSRGVKLSAFKLSHMKGLAYLFRKHGYVLGLGGLYAKINRNEARLPEAA